ISKMLLELSEKEIAIWKNLETILKEKKDNFINTEYSFLIKDELNSWNYYLTGRYDAIYKENDEYIIYDWKTLNLPKEAQNDLQSIVYLYCANKIFNSEKIKMRYLSIEKLDFIDVSFDSVQKYKNRIDSIILKLKDSD
ncbi:PD-(D/E)XK nuclease family protein, partial [bacterium]|nr:PD-(D/E)XK nuclease family protein [bacterium]